jgi:DNA-binding Lrp family transcriptional regulator
MPINADLDAIDWKILKELQDDGRITNVELSRRVGISAPPCLRRVKRLEEAGIIKGYRALLNTQQLGFPVVAFCLVGLQHQAEADLKAFAERAKAWAIVRRAWMVSGESDFLLHCVAPDLSTFQTFVIEELTSTPDVDTVRTALTIRQIKDEGWWRWGSAQRAWQAAVPGQTPTLPWPAAGGKWWTRHRQGARYYLA